jgi:hypothetical protein
MACLKAPARLGAVGPGRVLGTRLARQFVTDGKAADVQVVGTWG